MLVKHLGVSRSSPSLLCQPGVVPFLFCVLTALRLCDTLALYLSLDGPVPSRKEQALVEEKRRLLGALDEAHKSMQAALAGIDPHLALSPTWAIKQLIAHIAGWDDATIRMLRAHWVSIPCKVAVRARALPRTAA